MIIKPQLSTIWKSEIVVRLGIFNQAIISRST